MARRSCLPMPKHDVALLPALLIQVAWGCRCAGPTSPALHSLPTHSLGMMDATHDLQPSHPYGYGYSYSYGYGYIICRTVIGAHLIAGLVRLEVQTLPCDGIRRVVGAVYGIECAVSTYAGVDNGRRL